MAIYAVIDQSNPTVQKVINVIVADNIEIAKQVTNELCIDITINMQGVGIGWYYYDGEFSQIAPQPLPPPTPIE